MRKRKLRITRISANRFARIRVIRSFLLLLCRPVALNLMALLLKEPDADSPWDVARRSELLEA